MRTSLAAFLSIPLLPLALTFAAPAFAQPVDAASKSTARSMAEEGIKLYEKGNYADALDKFSRANDLVHAPTMALFTGRCLEKLGRWVEASEKYLEATRDTLEPGAAPSQKQAQADAEKARNALLPRIPAVEIGLDKPAPDASVVLDGKALPAAMLGVKRPIDPGPHTIEVSRGAGPVAKQSFSLKEAEAVRVEVKVPDLPPGATPGILPPPGTPGGPMIVYAPGTAPPVAKERRSTGLFVTGIVMIPVGAIGMVAGAAVAAGGALNGDSGAGLGILGASTLVLVGGIVMTVVGGKKIPVKADTAVIQLTPGVTLQPLVSPRSGGVRITF